MNRIGLRSVRKLLLIASLGLLHSCADLPVLTVCKELTLSRASCVYTNSDQAWFWDDMNLVDGKSYWQARPSMLQVPAESWAKLKSFVIKNCKKTGNCPETEKILLRLSK